MKSKLVVFVLIAVLAAVSIYEGEIASKAALGVENFALKIYGDFASAVKNKINEHFRQASEISALRAQNAELEKSAVLLSSFANELNQILKDKNVSAYSPQVKLVRALSYAQISDYDKIWLQNFEGFDPSKIYGLIYQGKSAGIVIGKNDRPLALLQTDPKSIFAVSIGGEKIPGVAHGDNDKIVVKFIPQWLFPKIGDEVFTSGLDGIFFGGVGVGKVSEVLEESLYKSVVVEPYVKLSIPSYLYVVTKEK